jgi:pimeloyl-ACP methyl ester carboxylesterase
MIRNAPAAARRALTTVAATLRISARAAHRARVALVLALLIPLPTLAVAMFAPGTASAALPMTAQEVRWLHATAAGRRLPDPRYATPAQVSRFFAALPDRAGQLLAARFPEVVGNLDGAPVALRYAANARLMAAAGGEYRSWDTPARHFLAFDPRGTGRAVEVVGDLATADRVAVLVPGVGNSIRVFDRPAGPHRNRAPAVWARSLYQQAEAQQPGARLAVIAWLGYRPPADLGREAAREELARTGAAALDRFVAGLAAVRPGATYTVVGHSYGSVVVGLAARYLPPAVTDLVAIGSPGLGVERAADLHTAARVYAGCSPDDWISDVPDVQVLGVGHGTEPVEPGFGARVFGTAGVHDHDEYLNPGTESLRNIAWIVLNRPSNIA